MKGKSHDFLNNALFLFFSPPLNLRVLLSGKNSIHKLHNTLDSQPIRPHSWNSKIGFGEVCSSREERSTIHFWIGYQILLVSDTIETANWLCNLLSPYFFICESSANEPFSAKQEGFTSKKFDEVLHPVANHFSRDLFLFHPIEFLYDWQAALLNTQIFLHVISLANLVAAVLLKTQSHYYYGIIQHQCLKRSSHLAKVPSPIVSPCWTLIRWTHQSSSFLLK